MRVLSPVMEGLTRLDFDQGEAQSVPALAKSWTETSPGHYVFQLRSEARWSDGEKLVAAHFVMAWKRLLENAARTPWVSLLYPISNARAFTEGKASFAQVGLTAPNPETLEVTLTRPSPLFLAGLSHPATWPIHPGGGAAGALGPTVGPFFLEKWVAGAPLHYVRNPYYYGGVVKVAAMEARVVADPLQRVQLFMDKQLDLVDEIPDGLATQLGNLPERKTEPSFALMALVFNPTRKPFQNAAVRRLFENALQRDAIWQLPRWPHSSAFRLFPFLPAARFTLPTGTLESRDARNLAEGLGLDLGSLRMLEGSHYRAFARPTIAWGGLETGEEVFQNLQAQWIKNLNLRVDPAPRGTVPAISLVEISPSLYSARSGLDGFFSASEGRPRELDAFITQAEAAEDLHGLRQGILEAEDWLVAKEALVMPLYFKARNALQRIGLRGISQNPVEIWDFRDTTMD